MTFLFEAARPATPVFQDYTAVTLGMRFSPDRDSDLTAVRVWRGDRVIRDYRAAVWDFDTGQVLLQFKIRAATTTQGWKSTRLTNPLFLRGGQNYVVGYHATSGKYPVSHRFFTEEAVRGLATVPKGAGVFRYGWPSVPRKTHQDANYWIDVSLVPTETQSANEGIETVPVFTVQPDNSVTVTENDVLILHASAHGSPEPMLHWQQYVGGAWEEIPGAVRTTLTRPMRLADTRRAFRCVAVNRAGVVASDPCVVTVTPNTVSTQPTFEQGVLEW